jgi:hypothetical protein
VLRQVRERALVRRAPAEPRRRRFGRRAELVRGWVQIVADLAAVVVRLVS